MQYQVCLKPIFGVSQVLLAVSRLGMSCTRLAVYQAQRTKSSMINTTTHSELWKQSEKCSYIDLSNFFPSEHSFSLLQTFFLVTGDIASGSPDFHWWLRYILIWLYGFHFFFRKSYTPRTPLKPTPQQATFSPQPHSPPPPPHCVIQAHRSGKRSKKAFFLSENKTVKCFRAAPSWVLSNTNHKKRQPLNTSERVHHFYCT